VQPEDLAAELRHEVILAGNSEVDESTGHVLVDRLEGIASVYVGGVDCDDRVNPADVPELGADVDEAPKEFQIDVGVAGLNAGPLELLGVPPNPCQQCLALGYKVLRVNIL